MIFHLELIFRLKLAADLFRQLPFNNFIKKKKKNLICFECPFNNFGF